MHHARNLFIIQGISNDGDKHNLYNSRSLPIGHIQLNLVGLVSNHVLSLINQCVTCGDCTNLLNGRQLLNLVTHPKQEFCLLYEQVASPFHHTRPIHTTCSFGIAGLAESLKLCTLIQINFNKLGLTTIFQDFSYSNTSPKSVGEIEHILYTIGFLQLR